jgi:hypothetical protein
VARGSRPPQARDEPARRLCGRRCPPPLPTGRLGGRRRRRHRDPLRARVPRSHVSRARVVPHLLIWAIW